jgi:hypothetical protein
MALKPYSIAIGSGQRASAPALPRVNVPLRSFFNNFALFDPAIPLCYYAQHEPPKAIRETQLLAIFRSLQVIEKTGS